MNKEQYCGEGCPGREICGLKECIRLGLSTTLPDSDDQIWADIWRAIRKEAFGRGIPDECIEELKKKYAITRKP